MDQDTPEEEVKMADSNPEHSPQETNGALSEVGNTSNDQQDDGDAVANILSLNQLYQHIVNEMLYIVQIIAKGSRAEQERLLKEVNLLERTKNKRNIAKRPVTLFSSPYFRDVRACLPPENDDAKEKQFYGDVDAYDLPPRPWVKSEEKNLIEGVRQVALEMALVPLSNKLYFYKEKRENTLPDSPEEEEIDAKIEEIKDEMNEIERKSVNELVEGNKEALDWLQIAAKALDGFRTPEECKNMFFNCLNPTINSKKFESFEDAMLLRLAEKYEEQDWDAIAEELNRNLPDRKYRSAIQCFERYQSHLNKNFLKKYWQPEDDQRLYEVVEACKIGTFIPWHKVIYCMDDWTRLQIINRYNRCILLQNRNGPWSKEEDAILYAVIQKHGANWAKASEYIPGRLNNVCRERYTNNLDPLLKTGNWTLEEDNLIIKMAAKYGDGKWGKICRHLAGRTDNMVSQRLNILKKHHKQLIKNILAKKYDNIDAVLPKVQSAPSKSCFHINQNRKKIQEQAINTIIEGLNKLDTGKVYTHENLDFQNLSAGVLWRLSDLLLPTEKCMLLKPKPTYGVRIKKEKRDSDDDDDTFCDDDDVEEDDNNEDGDDMNVEDTRLSDNEGSKKALVMNTGEIRKVNDKLSELFALVAATELKPNMSKKEQNYKTWRHILEFEVLKKYMFKTYKVDLPVIEDEVPLHTVYRSVNFEETVPRLLECLILSPLTEGHLPVIPPNITTVNAMLIFLLAKRFLMESIKAASHREIEIYNAVAVNNDPDDNNETCPICESTYFIRKEIEEQDVKEISDSCECSRIEKLRCDLKTLKERFLTVFLWPALLSMTKPTQEQISKLILKKQEEEPVNNANKPMDNTNKCKQESPAVITNKKKGNKRKSRSMSKKPSQLCKRRARRS